MAKRSRVRPPQAHPIRAFVTPEGVDLRLTLATIGDRAGAFMFDLMAISGTLIAMTVLAMLMIVGLGLGGANGTVAIQTIAVIWLLGAFVLRNFYFTAFELGSRGATPGKRAMKLRVVSRDGRRLSGHAVVVRNAMRELEFFLPLSFLAYESAQGAGGFLTSMAGLLWSGIFLLFPRFNRDNMRVGDLLAGTWVVRVPRKSLGARVIEKQDEPQYQFTDAQLNAYGEFELQKLEDVLRKQDELAVIIVARSIRTRIDWNGPDGDDMQFLRAYYLALCKRLERNMLFGKRRRDKHEAA